MPKKSKPKIQTKVTIAKDQLITMLTEAHELGYRTGLTAQQSYDHEQQGDCMNVVEEYFDICNN